MIPVFGCETAREMLPSFVDGELIVADQVAMEAHLRWCRTCAAHVDDLRVIGDALRMRALPGCDPDPELDALQSGVLSRWEAETGLSWTTYVRCMFDDLHVIWAAVGATAGVLACLLFTVGVISATDERASDSLAAIMDALGSPGSDQNPVQLDGRMLPPRLAIPELFDDSPELTRIPHDDAVFALATVVTREGRIADYSVLQSHSTPFNGGTTGATARDHGTVSADMSRLLSAVSTVRFSPAQAGGSPVAVNMVWLLARTTVRGTARPFDFDEFRPRTKGPRPLG